MEYVYIGDRYDPNYRISKEDLEILAKDVKKLLELTEKISKEKIMKKLTRFYGNPEYGLDCIENKQLTFIRPDKLNDPMDCVYATVTTIPTLQAVKQYASENNKIFYEDEYEKAKKALKEISNKSFVICFCGKNELGDEPQDNLYMWAHYSNGHRGIAIEFEFKEHEKNLQKIRYGIDEMQHITLEEYTKYVSKKLSENSDVYKMMKEKGENNLYVKSKNWAVENEYRLITENSDTSKSYVTSKFGNKIKISAVYLGCRLSNDNEERIIRQIKTKHGHAKIYKAKENHHELKLDFCEVI